MVQINIRNKNILSNLIEGEEVVHVGKKSFFEFIVFFILLTAGTCYIAYVPIKLLLPHIDYLVMYPNISILSALLFWYIFVGFLVFHSYKYVEDYFFTDIVLTNKRFIVGRFKDILSYDYYDILYIERLTGAGRGPSGMFLVTRDKEFIISFMNAVLIKEKIEEIYPDKHYVMPNPQKHILKILAIFLVIILIGVFVKYL